MSEEEKDHEYPYIRSLLNENDLIKRFNALKICYPRIRLLSQKPEIANLSQIDKYWLKSKDGYIILIERSEDYEKYSGLTDYFLEDAIIKARRYDQLSLLEYWENNKDKIIENLKQNKVPLTIRDKRQYINGQVQGCSKFRPTVMVGLIKHYRVKYILDFCSGWGDRLVGAMSQDISIKFYCGIDPNRQLHNAYKQMIKTFVPKSSVNKYLMIRGCAEEVDFPVPPNHLRKYDCVITSPPYYDLERYSEGESQSIIKYPTLMEWYDKFLIKSTRKAADVLEDNGLLILSINDKYDTGKDKFVERYLKDVSGWSDLKYEGSICYTEESSVRDGLAINCQPLWIWRKLF